MIPKFRVFNKSFGEWLDAQEIVLCNGKLFRDWRRFEDGFPLNMRDCDVMQSTGLKDINGVEIFEGDLVEHDDNINGHWETFEACEVVYDKDCAQFCFKDDAGNFLTDYRNLNVIGNIYENSDLLEAE
ncbi:YopX family protein [Enterococcus thailandicus]|uniref:YopX family protein n=1 Tax=Enterococcus thailandicus TaxID=417368 RepID=UPI0039A60DC8